MGQVVCDAGQVVCQVRWCVWRGSGEVECVAWVR